MSWHVGSVARLGPLPTRGKASKSNDYAAKITMRLVQLHTVTPHPPTPHPPCPVQQRGRLIVFYTDLRIFREARARIN